MTLVSQIITDAYRASNLIAVGVSPTANESAEALRYLNRLIASVYGNEVGENLTDHPVGDANETHLTIPVTIEGDQDRPRQNSRIVVRTDEARTVYLPSAPNDGARMAIVDPFNLLSANPMTIDGNGRAIESATEVTINTNGTSRVWLYRADLGNWVVLSSVDADDDMPFPTEFDDYFVSELAIRINPSYGRTVPDEVLRTLARIKTQLRARYRQSQQMESEMGLWWPGYFYGNFYTGRY